MFEQGHIEGVIFEPLKRLEDERGWLVEIFRRDRLAEELIPAMAYVSFSLPDVVRGPHEHREQTDRFAFIGPGDFKLYCWDARDGSPTCGNRSSWIVGESNRQAVIVPCGVVHAYKNVGEVAGWIFNAANRLYAGEGKREAVDEVRHEDQPDNPYVLD